MNAEAQVPQDEVVAEAEAVETAAVVVDDEDGAQAVAEVVDAETTEVVEEPVDDAADEDGDDADDEADETKHAEERTLAGGDVMHGEGVDG